MTILRVAIALCWIVWLIPFIRAPHQQKRESITVVGPTRLGLFLEILAIALVYAWRFPAGTLPGLGRVVAAIVLAGIALILAWTAVPHLGRQFRLHAGLYVDHELVRSGPYSVVRHPIYSSLLAMLLSTALLLTPWLGILVSLAVFILGTEIRIHSEDKLLASRFGEQFTEYKRNVRAYVPFLR
jgi:protein-S-isoprenylcysteine O-methyltransferase Ste14